MPNGLSLNRPCQKGVSSRVRYGELHDQQDAWEANAFVNPDEDFLPVSDARR